MGAKQVWGRLLWKEFREGRFVLLVAALAPLLIRVGLQELARRPDAFDRSVIEAMMLIPAIGIHLAIAFWATSRGGSRRTGGEFSWTHLPTSPAIEWLASMIVPTIIIAALGAWFGWCANPPTVNEAWAVSVPVAGMLDLATTFVICYLVSMVVSSWAAYIVGVFRLIGGTLISVINLTLMLEGDAVATVARTLVGAIVGAFIFVVPFRKKSLAFRQATSLIAVVLITFVPLVPQIPIGDGLTKLVAMRYGNDELNTYQQDSADRSVRVRFDKSRNTSQLLKAGKVHLIMHDYRRDIIRKRLFPTSSVFNVQPSGRAYLASTKPGQDGVRITEWDGVRDSVRTIAVIPIKGRYFGGENWQCSVSPDGKYMALLLKSVMRNNTQDLWLLDLSHGNARLALPCLDLRSVNNYEQAWHIAWPKGKVGVWSPYSGAITVDLDTLARKQITFDKEVSEL